MKEKTLGVPLQFLFVAGTCILLGILLKQMWFYD